MIKLNENIRRALEFVVTYSWVFLSIFLIAAIVWAFVAEVPEAPLPERAGMYYFWNNETGVVLLNFSCYGNHLSVSGTWASNYSDVLEQAMESKEEVDLFNVSYLNVTGRINASWIVAGNYTLGECGNGWKIQANDSWVCVNQTLIDSLLWLERQYNRGR